MTSRPLCLGLLLVSCGGAKSTPTRGDNGPLRFGFTQPIGAKAAEKSSSRLGGYLTIKLDREVQAKIFDSSKLVLEGKVDAAVTLSDYRGDEAAQPDSCTQAGMQASEFEIIEAVGPIPNDVIAVRPKLPAAVRDQLREVLQAMKRTETGR